VHVINLENGNLLYTFFFVYIRFYANICVSTCPHEKKWQGQVMPSLFFCIVERARKTLLKCSIIDRLFFSADLMFITASDVVVGREKKNSVNSFAYSEG